MRPILVRNTRFALLCGVLVAVAVSLAARGEAAASPPAAPPAPAAPTPGADAKPAGDALAVEAESKPSEPAKEDEKKKPSSPWSGHIGVGFNFTRGNSETRSFNFALVGQYDPHTGNIVQADAFYILSSDSGQSTSDRSSAHLRDEHRLGGRWFAFADGQYVKDKFKAIDYMLAPTAGAGYRLIDEEDRKLQADLGAGAVFERDSDSARTSGGAVRLGEQLSLALSKTATLTNRGFVLLKSAGQGGAFYYLDLGVAAAINDHFELKLALIDEYQSRPADVTIKRNDLAGIVSFLYKR